MQVELATLSGMYCAQIVDMWRYRRVIDRSADDTLAFGRDSGWNVDYYLKQIKFQTYKKQV